MITPHSHHRRITINTPTLTHHRKQASRRCCSKQTHTGAYNLKNCLAMKFQRHAMERSTLFTDSTLHAQNPMERCLALHCIFVAQYTQHNCLLLCTKGGWDHVGPGHSQTPTHAARHKHTPGCLQHCGGATSATNEPHVLHNPTVVLQQHLQHSHTCHQLQTHTRRQEGAPWHPAPCLDAAPHPIPTI